MDDIETELEGAAFEWTELRPDTLKAHDGTATAYEGRGERWMILVVSFDAGRAGRGFDGTARDLTRGLVVRLPRSLAARLHGEASGERTREGEGAGVA